MPSMYSLYQNNSFLIAPNDYSTTMGNAELKAEKTVTYELGLWQELAPGTGLEVSLFYRDIYNSSAQELLALIIKLSTVYTVTKIMVMPEV